MMKPVHLTTLAVAMLLSQGVLAAEGTGCAAFKWPVVKEQALFADNGIASAASGDALAALPDAAIQLTLVDATGVKFPVPPSGKAKDGPTKGAVLNIGSVAKKGTYQVTLSDEAWVDLIQGGEPVRSTDHSGATGCTGVRKIVRFDLIEGPLVVEISKASVAGLKLSIRPAE